MGKEMKKFDFARDCNDSPEAKMWNESVKNFDSCRVCMEISTSRKICENAGKDAKTKEEFCKSVNNCWMNSMDKTADIKECIECYQETMPKEVYEMFAKKNNWPPLKKDKK